MHDDPTNLRSDDDAPVTQANAASIPVRRLRFNPRLLGKAWRRRTRWLWRVLLGGPLLLLILALLLIRSPVVAYLARGAIEPLLGCSMHAGSVAISLDGRLIMEELSLRVPGMDTPGAEFLYVRRAEADLDWSGLLRGEVNPTGLRLVEPVFRVSQSTVSGQISIASLRPVAQTKQRLTQPPKINVLDGVVEVGEHTPAHPSTHLPSNYRVLTRLSVSGNVEPSDPLRPIYSVRLQEKIKLPAASSPGTPSNPDPALPEQFTVGMIVDGTIDLDHSTARIRVVNIGVNPWPEGSVPTYMRTIWERLNINGRISETLLTYDPTNGPEASITVDRASMNALVPAAEHSGKIDDMLSLDSVVGTVKVSTNRVTAELDATLEGQTAPAHISLDYAGIAEDAPFTCTITTKDFRVDRNPGWLAFTPVQVKENLAAFSGPTALVSGTVVLERAAPIAPTVSAGPSTAAPLRVGGWLDLSEGTAAFHRVPYPFKHVSGRIDFDQDGISLTRIDGRADSGATVHATGTIAPPNDAAEVSLHIVVENIPLDHVFADSLPPSRRGAMSFLFSQQHYASLRKQGLVSNQTTRVTASRDRDDYDRERRRLIAALPDDIENLEHWLDDSDAVLDDIDARIRECDRFLTAPDFDLGGVASLDIRVHTPAGKDAPWTYTVMVTIPRAGFLLAGFPLPVLGTGVLMQITQDTATVLEGTFAGLGGGHLDIDAKVILDEGGHAVVKPDVRVRANGLTIDDLLLFAVRRAADSSPVATADSASAADLTPDASALEEVLHSLDRSGTLSCDVSVWPIDADSLDARAEISIAGAQLGPFVLADGSRLFASNLDAIVRVDSNHVHLPMLRGDLRSHSLTGSINRPVYLTSDAGSFTLLADATLRSTLGSMLGSSLAATSSDPDAAPIPSHTPAPFTIAADPALPIVYADATLLLSNADASLDIASLIQRFAPSAAASIGDFTAAYRPQGRFDAELAAAIQPGTPARLDVRLHRAAALSLDYEGDRVDFDMNGGSLAVRIELPADPVPSSAAPSSPSPPRLIVFDEARFTLHSATSPPVHIHADGLFSLALPGVQAGVIPDAALRLRVENLTFESCLVRGILGSRLDPGSVAQVDAFDPHGGFDADLLVQSAAIPALHSASDPRDSALQVSGTLRPSSLSLVVDSTRLDIPRILGEIAFDSERVWTDALALTGDDWSVVLHAERATHALHDAAESAPRLRLAAIAHADSLTPALRAIIPAAVLARLDESKTTIAGPISLSPFLYTSVPDPASTLASVRLEGVFEFAGLSMADALSVQNATGRCDFTLLRPAGQDHWSFDTHLRAPRLTLAGLEIRTLQAHARSGSAPGVILFPAVSAECYSGRITGSGSIQPSSNPAPPDAPDAPHAPDASSPREYRAELSLAGVRFAPVLEALSLPDPAAAQTSPSTLQPSSTSRGSVDASVSISGIIDQPSSRAGLGRLRIAGGDVIRMPVVMSLMQLSNFQLPAKDSFDYLQASFQLSGHTVTFDQVALISRTLAITGFGTMTWPDQRLDLRFNSRSAGRLPFVSDVVEALRNEVVTTRITGTLMQPSIDPEPLMGTRQLIGSALGQPTGPKRSVSEQDADAAARAERDRLKGTSSVPTEP